MEVTRVRRATTQRRPRGDETTGSDAAASDTATRVPGTREDGPTMNVTPCDTMLEWCRELETQRTSIRRVDV
ncbi:MAG: hypothetical protein OHK0013_26370 [Sandaracinaceae bacterium]